MKKLSLLIVFLSTTLLVNAQIDLNKGLMLYLPFNGNTLDASPMANHATNYGATLTDDQWGNPNSAYRFNGVSDYMQIKDDTSLSPTRFTICARVKMMGFYEDDNCYNNVILTKGSDYTSGHYSMRSTQTISAGCGIQDTNQHVFRCDMGTIAPSIPDIHNPPYIKTNEWNCLIGTYDYNDTVSMYVNGTLRYKFYNPTKGTNTVDLIIGRMTLSSWRASWFNGVIDEIRIYNRVLNTEERDSICSTTNPKLSIKTIKDHPILTLYPNPATNKVAIDIAQNELGGELSIIDLSGKVITHIQQLENNQIEIDNLAKGFYMVEYLQNHKTFRGKMIKQ